MAIYTDLLYSLVSPIISPINHLEKHVKFI